MTELKAHVCKTICQVENYFLILLVFTRDKDVYKEINIDVSLYTWAKNEYIWL